MQIYVAPDSTTLSYWLNWRVFLCAVLVVTPLFAALFLIWKYERLEQSKSDESGTQKDVSCVLHDADVWMPCLKQIHPFWLLAFRVTAFCLALATLIVKVVNGGSIVFYYTQWTFTLVTIYFGLGSLFSIYGCYQYSKRSSWHFNVNHVAVDADAEQGYFVPLINGKSTNIWRKCMNSVEKCYVSQAAGFCCYLFQIVFQMNGGAVMLTDCIYWAIIFPFLTIQDYDLNFMTVNLHTLNLILLLCDTALNSMSFPWFRISYFILWTCTYVIFQWIVHACISIRWPYAFLDLSSPHAPLWYLSLALMHLPCYGLFVLVVKTKHNLLSKWFPQSYNCLR